jgi:hypothetical protein
MFVNERALLVAMAFNTGLICTHSQFGLFVFEAAVSVMAVTAFHRTLKHFVMIRLLEL